MGAAVRDTWRDLQRMERDLMDLFKQARMIVPKTRTAAGGATAGKKPQAWLPKEDTEFFPKTDVKDMEGMIEIIMEVPGVNKKDLSVELKGDAVVIRGVKPKDMQTEGINFLNQERSTGTFCRTFEFPECVGVDERNVKAYHNNGMLRVTVPKSSPEARRSYWVPLTEQ